MSRAFVKEPDGAIPEALPPRRISKAPNCVTPAGLRALEAEVDLLSAEHADLLLRGNDDAAHDRRLHVECDLNYVKARLDSAILVDPAAQPHDRVAFGATVAVDVAARSEEPSRRTYTIVGEDEADATAGKVNYVSPLAKALTDGRVGDTVIWRRPVGNTALTIRRIDYEGA